MTKAQLHGPAPGTICSTPIEAGNAAMPDLDLLRLVALDDEDLQVLSAHLQDAVVKVDDITWLPRQKRLVICLNRFAWEAAVQAGSTGRYQRRRAALHFERVEKVQCNGLDPRAKDGVLALLAIQFKETESPSGEVLLLFSGEGALRVDVECLEAQLRDLGPAWSTERAPRHSLA